MYINYSRTDAVIITFFILYILYISPNTGKYKPEITPYLDTFHAMSDLSSLNHRACIKKAWLFLLSYWNAFTLLFFDWSESPYTPRIEKIRGIKLMQKLTMINDIKAVTVFVVN